MNKDQSGPSEEEELKDIEMSFTNEDGLPCFIQIPAVAKIIDEIEKLRQELVQIRLKLFELEFKDKKEPTTPKLNPNIKNNRIIRRRI